MKVVTISGSMRYAKQMRQIARDLETGLGYCVLQPVYNDKKTKESIEDIERSYACHMKKVELSDAIYVVNIDGYIGEFTKNEIKFAKKLKKEIIYHEPIKKEK